MSRIKFSTRIPPLKVNNKNIEIKHDICSRLNVIFQTTRFPLSLPMPYFNVKDIKEQFTGKKSCSEKFG